MPNHAWLKHYPRQNFGHKILDFDKILVFLSNKAQCANFDLTTMFYIENGAHTQILIFYMKWIFKLTHATTVKFAMCFEKFILSDSLVLDHVCF